MKKVVKKQPKTLEDKIDDLATVVDTLAIAMANGFSSLEDRFTKRIDHIEKTIATKADILELHDKFIHRREFDQLSLRVSKLEEKARR